MGRIYLPVVFNNIPFPFSSILFYTLLWIIGCLFLYRHILFSKDMLYVYFMLIIIAIGMHLFWQDRIVRNELISIRWLIDHIRHIFLAILIYTYFIKRGDYQGLAYVVFFTLSFICITAITTIIGLNKYPMAARELAAGAVRLGERAAYYQSIGIMGYGFVGGLAFLMPVLVYKIKNAYKNKSKKTVLFLSMAGLFLFTIIQSRYTMALLFALFFAVMAVFQKNTKTVIVILCLILITISFVPPTFFANIFIEFSTLFEGTLTEQRISDFAMTFQHGEMDRDSEYHTARRLGRIPILLESILSNPITGGGENLGHNYWLDWMSLFGILGLFPWAIIIINQINNNLTIFDDDYGLYYILSMVAFITFGMFNNIGGSHLITFAFFIIPGLNFLKYIKNNNGV